MTGAGYALLAGAILAAGAVGAWDRWRARRLLRRLEAMLDAAVQGTFLESGYDESLLSAVEAPGVMGSLMKAAQDSAKQAAAQKASYEKICADSSAAYAERNPHTKKEG